MESGYNPRPVLQRDPTSPVRPTPLGHGAQGHQPGVLVQLQTETGESSSRSTASPALDRRLIRRRFRPTLVGLKQC